jgi:uncharacterized protein involved in cysteine biosynthesis
MNYVLEALDLVRRDRSLWGYVWKPLAISALLYLGVLALGLSLSAVFLGRLASSLAGVPPSLAPVVGAGVFFVAWFFIGGLVFVTLAAMVSSQLWDRLSTHVERSLTGSAPEAPFSMRLMAAEMTTRLLFAFGMLFLGIIGGFFVPVVSGVICAGIVGLMDFTASPFGRRRLRFRDQRKLILQMKNWQGFLLSAGVLSLFPFVNVVMMPILVIAGTMMFVRSNMDVRIAERQVAAVR